MVMLYRRFSTLTDAHITGFEVARVLFTQMTWWTDLFGFAGMLSTTAGWSSEQCGTRAFIFVTADHLHSSATSSTVSIYMSLTV